MNSCIQQSGLGYSLPVSGGDLPVSMLFMWERHIQDTKTPFVIEGTQTV